MSFAFGWDVIQAVTQAPGYKIIMLGDDWTLSDGGHTEAPTSTPVFARNCIEWMTGKTSGANIGRGFFYNPTTTVSTWTTAGHSVSGVLSPFSADYATHLALLQSYECMVYEPYSAAAAIFGNYQAWIDYIAGGGAVLWIMGNYNNHSWINTYVTQDAYNIVGDKPGGSYVANVQYDLTDWSANTHMLFNGVGDLYFYGSATVEIYSPPDPKCEIFTGVHDTEGDLDMLGVYDGTL